MQLPGVAMTREPRRFYPNRALAATVMGHAGSDGGGLDGVELALDKTLRGTTSSVQGVRDALGREIAIDGALDTPSTAGSDVVLTIDRYLTFITERALAAGAAEHHAKGAIAIMMGTQPPMTCPKTCASALGVHLLLDDMTGIKDGRARRLAQ